MKTKYEYNNGVIQQSQQFQTLACGEQYFKNREQEKHVHVRVEVEVEVCFILRVESINSVRFKTIKLYSLFLQSSPLLQVESLLKCSSSTLTFLVHEPPGFIGIPRFTGSGGLLNTIGRCKGRWREVRRVCRRIRL